MARNTTNVNDTYTVTVYDGSTSLGTATLNSNTNWSKLDSIGYLSVGNYTYSVAYNDEVVCSHTITVAEPVGCSVNSTTIGLGGNFTFTTTYPGNCYWSTFTADPNDGSGLSSPSACQSSYSVTPTAVGTYTYTYGVTSGEYGTDSCSQTVTVERVAPTFACPSSARATIGASNNVSLSLGDVTGCDEGGNYCYYSITGADNISVSGTGYASGVVASFTDANVTTDGAEKSYTVRLTNSVGYVEHDCSVDFVEGSASPDYTICLDKNDNNGWPQITSGISAVGTYEVLHDCQGTESYSYFYNCSNGADITWDGTALICDGSEHQATAANMPSSGSILTINSGTITKIGCGY